MADDWLSEQRAYYRAVAPDYERYAIPGAWGGEPVEALHRFAPAGDVLELACGPGTWTVQLLAHATSVTAVDASPEMLAIATNRVNDPRVRFVEAEIFRWEPDRTYDVVFFGFWLSHVPLTRFADFWSLVDRCLVPSGRVFFVDDAHRTPEELVYGAESETVRRRLLDGSDWDVIKVAHTPAELEARLAALGWAVSVTQSPDEPFYWGGGGRSG